MFESLLKASPTVSKIVEEWSKSTLKKLENYGNNSLIYKFYNQLFLKIDNNIEKIQVYFNEFFIQIWKQFEASTISTVPQLSFLLGEIITFFN